MAKGSGSDYENLEDDENVSENYCEDNIVAGGENEGNFDDAGDEEFPR